MVYLSWYIYVKFGVWKLKKEKKNSKHYDKKKFRVLLCFLQLYFSRCFFLYFLQSAKDLQRRNSNSLNTLQSSLPIKIRKWYSYESFTERAICADLDAYLARPLGHPTRQENTILEVFKQQSCQTRTKSISTRHLKLSFPAQTGYICPRSPNSNWVFCLSVEGLPAGKRLVVWRCRLFLSPSEMRIPKPVQSTDRPPSLKQPN